MKILFAPEAEADLRDSLRYIAERSPQAAKELGDRVLDIVKKLAAGDFEGQEQQLTTGEVVRSWPVHPFRVYYQRTGDIFHILRIYDHARQPIAK